MTRLLILISSAISLAGCATTAAEIPGTGATFCQLDKPIYWSKNDTRMTKEQVDTHNRVGKKVCGWGKK